ncbi:MAG: FliM/FliN family flagellar motor switch protein [Phycisphaerae bacterium]|nr:FliM/FliN family flagellar motor switch protein [Phycisphaerae bacterium]
MADEEATTEQQPDAADEASEAPEGVDVEEAQLADAGPDAGQTGDGQIDILLDATVPVEVSLGQLDMQIRDVLQLGGGSVVTLDKQAGEPVDLYLRGVRFATGQLVVVGERLGVRIEQIVRQNG